MDDRPGAGAHQPDEPFLDGDPAEGRREGGPARRPGATDSGGRERLAAVGGDWPARQLPLEAARTHGTDRPSRHSRGPPQPAAPGGGGPGAPGLRGGRAGTGSGKGGRIVGTNSRLRIGRSPRRQQPGPAADTRTEQPWLPHRFPDGPDPAFLTSPLLAPPAVRDTFERFHLLYDAELV